MMKPIPIAVATFAASALALALPGAQQAPVPPAFAHSDDCVSCHNQIITSQGEDVSIGATWRATMMANSARDPYWHAGVRRETIDHPRHAEEIQNECAACHMPMAQRMAQAEGRQGAVFAHLPFTRPGASEETRLAADGISCTVCHQIAKDKLGTPDSFNSGFVVVPPKDGVRQILGPYAIDQGRRTIMRSVTAYEQVEAPHIGESELCASCHTLITQAFGAGGEVIGRLPEQMNYQEWQHSAFAQEKKSCQSCHMPRAPGPVRIASVLGDYRDHLSRHLFVGGNAFMLRIFNRYRDELGVAALPAELDAAAHATVRQLQQDTATLSVSSPSVTGSTLAFDVEIRNLTGHKFPTGYPSRRTWLHVTVRDRDGRVVFESGAVQPDGSIRGNDSDADASRFEPHYEEIATADQVQIYEPILGDPKGRPTTGLLTATQYLKDSRLLPRGFDKATAHPDVGVYGGARQDADFTAGGDRVRYRLPLPSSAVGPFAADVELLYQTIAYRWARNLDPYDAPEPKRFLRYWNEMASASSVVVARSTVTVAK
jgi:hypothetical protein